jgi:hypothetical protein
MKLRIEEFDGDYGLLTNDLTAHGYMPNTVRCKRPIKWRGKTLVTGWVEYTYDTEDAKKVEVILNGHGYAVHAISEENS